MRFYTIAIGGVPAVAGACRDRGSRIPNPIHADRQGTKRFRSSAIWNRRQSQEKGVFWGANWPLPDGEMSAEYRPQKTACKGRQARGPFFAVFSISRGRLEGVPKKMRMTLVVAAAIACCVGLLAVGKLSAQRPQAPHPPTNGTVLVDMSAIMKNSARFNQSMEQLKKEYEAKAEELKRDGERGNQLTQQLRKLPATSPTSGAGRSATRSCV